MKRLGSPRRLRAALPLLAMAVLLTVPATATASKYVWQDTIDITLKVVYPESEFTSLRPGGHPSKFWVQDLTNIAAAPTAEGLVLTAADGYTLPGTITVKIGQQTFLVGTDGTQNPAGITFQPETGLLSIQEALIEQNPGGVTVQAAAEAKTDDPGTSSAGQSDPAPDTTAASGSAAPEEQPPRTGSTPHRGNHPGGTFRPRPGATCGRYRRPGGTFRQRPGRPGRRHFPPRRPGGTAAPDRRHPHRRNHPDGTFRPGTGSAQRGNAGPLPLKRIPQIVIDSSNTKRVHPAGCTLFAS